MNHLLYFVLVGEGYVREGDIIGVSHVWAWQVVHGFEAETGVFD
jgi:hypothetical protein